MPGGGTLTIKTKNQYLHKPVSGYDEVKEGDYVVLSVSDTGEGIPAADLKRISESFYTGTELSRQLMAIRPDLPVILCTGFSDSLTPEKSEAAGIRALAMKPIVLSHISSIIRKALN
jgi:DNA-binding NarL/FixJ family response regulator